MRDLDNRDLIVGDFLLVLGDVVSNLSLESALSKHRARREKDRNAIMTMVLREAGVQHRTKTTGKHPVFVIDPGAERCLHYEEMGRGGENGGYVMLAPELLTSHGELEVREDLIDCSIDICSLDVLGLWSDNFDYQSLRKSFLSDVLKDYDLNGKTIHTHIIADQYAARVKSLRAYDAITKDVTKRWTYPICPDSNLVRGQSYRFRRGKVYEEENVLMTRGSMVKSTSVLGRGTAIRDGGVVGSSVLGRNCKIGKNVIVEGSYVWNDVTIEEGSIVRQAIIADGAVIGKHCRIEPGALISFGVRIADNTTVPGTSKITRAKRKAVDSSAQTDSAIVGKAGEGHQYSPDSDDDSDTSNAFASYQNHLDSPASYSDSSISSFSDSDSEYEALSGGSRRSSFVSNGSGDAIPNRDFHIEATASIFDGLQKGDLPENIFLELNGYRMAQDASQHEVRHAVVAALMRRISNLAGDDAGAEATEAKVREAVETVLRKYRELAERTIFDKEADEKVDQVDFLMLVQKESVGKTNGGRALLCVSKEMYDLEIVEEEGVAQWWEDERGHEGEMGQVRGLTEAFIVWLKEAEVEDDDDDEDNEEDEE